MSTLRCFALVFVILAATLGSAYAAVPPMMSYQGKLMQPSGAPVPDGSYSLQFAVYDVPTGGTALWSETNPGVQVKGGLFSVLLGSVNNLPGNIFDNPSRFFGVKVGADPEMSPRQQIASVGYAFRSATAGTVDDGAITEAKLVDGAVTSVKLALASVTSDKIAPSAGVPVGTVLSFAGSVVPQGWLVCDGSAISRSAYPELFAAIGTGWGSGDSTSTFNLPDLRGKFLRGQDAGSGIDPDRIARVASKPGGNTGDDIGSVQGDALQGHKHSSNGVLVLTNALDGPHQGRSIGGPNSTWPSLESLTNGYSADGSNGMPRISGETRPVNANVSFIISTGR